jgi:diketogulonate reductase-like aldo/keto reductase
LVDEDALAKVLRILTLAVLLSLNIPLSVKKRIIYDLFNSLGMKLSEEELREIEAMYTAPKYEARFMSEGEQK